MSLFTCLDTINELQHYFRRDTASFNYLEIIKQQVSEASDTNNPLLLKAPIDKLRQLSKGHSFFAVLFSRPLNQQDRYSFQIKGKLEDIYFELKACMQLGEKEPVLNIHSFQLPSIKAPHFSSDAFRQLYDEIKMDLKSFKNKPEEKYIYQKWQAFSQKTQTYKNKLATSQLSKAEAYQAKQYFELRQGVQNQMALAYLCHKNKVSEMNYQADWRQGLDAQTGYGYVMAMAVPVMASPALMGTDYRLNAQVDFFERNKSDSTLDQKQIKHNRITPLSVSTTSNRAKDLLDLAKQNLNQHLKIKLFSRGFSERYSYLQFSTKADRTKIIFCEPRHGVFEFDNEEEFLFFYEMVYAKEQMQTGLCWNRYQVSLMHYAPNEAAKFTWQGKLRSLLTGLKYNQGLINRVKNFILFNITLTVFLIASYSLTCMVAAISPFIGTLLLTVLAQNLGSSYLSLAFIFGSAGIFSTWDVIYAASLTLSDAIKSLFGFKTDHEEILHKPFDLPMAHLNTHSSHQHLIDALAIDRKTIEACVDSLITTIEKKQPDNNDMSQVDIATQVDEADKQPSDHLGMNVTL